MSIMVYEASLDCLSEVWFRTDHLLTFCEPDLDFDLNVFVASHIDSAAGIVTARHEAELAFELFGKVSWLVILIQVCLQRGCWLEN